MPQDDIIEILQQDNNQILYNFFYVTFQVTHVEKIDAS